MLGVSLIEDECCSEFGMESTLFGSSERYVGALSKEHVVIGKLKKGSNVEKEFAHMYQAQQVSRQRCIAITV